MKRLIISRLQEPSTWRGLVAVASAFGVALSPDLIEHIVAAGMGVSGLIGAFTTDNS